MTRPLPPTAIRPFCFGAALTTTLLTTALLALGCGSDVATSCQVGDTSHAIGDTFPSSDGCNTCTCEPGGGVSCTEKGCMVTCTYEGQMFSVGASFPASDGCNTCSCGQDGEVACTAIGCPSCSYGGVVYKPGDSFPASDGCNTCSCGEDGSVGCTELACPTCTYAGTNYPVGASFPAVDGCNTCTCGEGAQVGCTKMVCACDPSKEWWRKYVGMSPQECMTIKFVCEPNTVMFANDCGCGCEQSATCPEFIDCMPPKPCDIEKIKAECPYTTIAL